MNLFAGLSSQQIESVIVGVVLFTAASGLCLVALIAFGVRAGLMLPRATEGIPPGSAPELVILLASSAAGFLADVAMIFFGLTSGSVFAEFYLVEPVVIVSSVILIGASGLLLLAGVGLGLRTVRRSRTSSRA